MSTEQSTAARAAYRWCRAQAQSHYENFPVASRLMPARLRDPVAAIYTFARRADDIADEGDDTPAQRLAALDALQATLDTALGATASDDPLFVALTDAIARHRLPVTLFHDLLSAFRQDVVKQRYANFGELMAYCRRSANPVGRLLLHLAGQDSPRNLALSDAVCSALQLTNFLQDIEQDYAENARIYLPQDELERFGVSEQNIAAGDNTPALRACVQFQVQRTAGLLRSGSLLGKTLRGRFGLEIRAIILGGSRVLEKLYRQTDPFSRPRLDARDRLGIAWGALRQGFT